MFEDYEGEEWEWRQFNVDRICEEGGNKEYPILTLLLLCGMYGGAVPFTPHNK